MAPRTVKMVDSKDTFYWNENFILKIGIYFYIKSDIIQAKIPFQ